MNKKLSLLLSIFFISFLLFVSFVIFEKPLSGLTRAKEEFLPSINQSLIIAYPLTVKADGKSKSEISVFIRSTIGTPVLNTTVNLTSTLGNINPTSSITNKEGKASFTITSEQPGIASVEAKVNNQSLDKKISILFK